MSQLAQTENWKPLGEHLFPIESRNVRQCMIDAADWSKEENFFLSRISSVSLTVIAVVMSAVNTLAYLVSAPIELVLNAVHLNPLKMVTNFSWDLINAVRSFVFVALGVSLIVIGLIIPEQTFVCFAPLFAGTPTEKIENEKDEFRAMVRDYSQKSVEWAAAMQQSKDGLKRKENEIVELHAELGNKDAIIRQLQENIAQRDNPLEAQIAELNERNTQLEERQFVFRPFGYNIRP